MSSSVSLRRVSQGLGLLGRELEAFGGSLSGTEVDDEGENLHFRAAERAQERLDFVDAANQLRPAEAGASGELHSPPRWRPRGSRRRAPLPG